MILLNDSPTPIRPWGAEVDYPSSRSTELYSHIVGARYPCRSVPMVPREILGKLRECGVMEARVLDPFMGSGTTALEACLNHYQPVGLEVDPYARLISNASVQLLGQTEIDQLNRFLVELPERFKATKPDSSLLPDIPNIEHWFSPQNIQDLLKLKTIIVNFTQMLPHVEGFLLAAFGDIIRAASNAERQSLKPYVSTRFIKKPGEPMTLYQKALTRYLEGAKAVLGIAGYTERKIEWAKGDALSFECNEKVDVAITSPPYINAMDYVRCIRLESSWVGTGNAKIFKEIRDAQFGEASRTKRTVISADVSKIIKMEYEAVRSIDSMRALVMGTYFEDMKLNFLSVAKALKNGGTYHIIVGNSMVRNTEVETHRLLAEIAESVGFVWTEYFKYRIKDHRTSLPRNGRGGKISFEHVISLSLR